MTAMLIAYGSYKTKNMLEYSHMDVTTPDAKNYFDSSKKFDMELGWRVGFGLTAYDSNSDPTPLDDTIGKLSAYQKEWGQLDEFGNKKPIRMRPLKTRPCTRADINFEGKKDSSA